MSITTDQVKEIKKKGGERPKKVSPGTNERIITEKIFVSFYESFKEHPSLDLILSFCFEQKNSNIINNSFLLSLLSIFEKIDILSYLNVDTYEKWRENGLLKKDKGPTRVCFCPSNSSQMIFQRSLEWIGTTGKQIKDIEINNQIPIDFVEYYQLFLVSKTEKDCTTEVIFGKVEDIHEEMDDNLNLLNIYWFFHVKLLLQMYMINKSYKWIKLYKAFLHYGDNENIISKRSWLTFLHRLLLDLILEPDMNLVHVHPTSLSFLQGQIILSDKNVSGSDVEEEEEDDNNRSSSDQEKNSDDEDDEEEKEKETQAPSISKWLTHSDREQNHISHATPSMIEIYRQRQREYIEKLNKSKKNGKKIEQEFVFDDEDDY